MKRMMLTKLVLSGTGKNDAILSFEKGLNVVTGDSDTGKTYAFQCLNYILGGERLPKKITEAQGYGVLSLEFIVDDEPYKIERMIGSSKVEIYYNEEKNVMPTKHDATNPNNLSRYLLQLLQEHEENALLKKNNKNDTRTLSFRDIVHLVTVDETDIISENSAFSSDQYTEKTVRKSVFKYVITGNDDSELEEVVDVSEENIRRTGVVQFLQKKRKSLLDKIDAIEGNKNFKLYTESESIHLMINKINNLRDEIAKMNVELTDNQVSIHGFEKKCFSDEVKMEEFQKLNQHYVAELKKNQMILTYSDFLIQLPHLDCPVCSQSILPDIITPANSDELFEYYKNYTLKLNQKVDGLKVAINDIVERLASNKENINKLADENKNLTKIISEKQTILSSLNRNIAEIRQLEAMKKSLEIYHQELVSVENDIIFYNEKVKNTKAPSNNRNIFIYDGYCRVIENVLEAWGFSDEVKVKFDIEKLDLVINEKARSEWGKGYRAFIMSAMVIGLMRYCIDNNQLHPGFVIIDSPLVSLKERKKDVTGKWVDDYMEKKMIEDIIEKDCFNQVIIFENKDIKYDLKYNYTELNHYGDGRKGFIPLDTED
ncbi:AAA family ATPase [Alkalibacter mobilis]|uniref:AAA family ATPase n=1 Tax=Alkalibacter mobilis TaxID=2787712 RepID=UPI0018A0AD97|nr:AAA family ATPase [Alkalibacter mobilis]MBF7097805.1 hypothetical protein [Alkalibacter mobilis]